MELIVMNFGLFGLLLHLFVYGDFGNLVRENGKCIQSFCNLDVGSYLGNFLLFPC